MLATISDAQTAAGSLQIQLSNPLLGVNVTEPVNVNGAITARVVATCGAVLGAQALGLRVTDGGGASSNANLPLTILANHAPVVGNYATANMAAGATLAAMPVSGLSDNGFLTNLQASSATFSGTLSVAATTGVVTISNARPTGVHNVTLAATDNCGATTTRAFALNVTRAETATRLTVPNSVFTANQSVTLTTNVSSNVALGATGLPTGSIALLEGTTTLQRATLDAVGAARFTATVPVSGLRELRVQYEGDAQYAASVSPLVVLSVASPFVSASAASYEAGVAAPEQILAAFGVRLSSVTLAARTVPLPLTLNDLVLRVRDAAGVERLAPLFFVSPNQINYQLPAGTVNGSALLTLTPVNDRNALLAAGTVLVVDIVPGLFTADASGKGWPVAQLLRIAANGALSYEPITRYDDAQRRFVALPINFSATTDQLFLILFGTGWRGRANLSEVTATIGNTPVEVLFAGAQGALIGVDQINLTLPRNLAGRGELDLRIAAQGKPANVVKLLFR